MVDYTESGVLTTAADLVFAGGREGQFFALDARSGELLWKMNLGGTVASGPITFMADGHQYVAVSADNALYVFGLQNRTRSRLRQNGLDGLLDLFSRSQPRDNCSRAVQDVQRRRAVQTIELRDWAIEVFPVRELRPGHRLLLHELVEPIEIRVNRDADEHDILRVLRVQLLE